MKSEWTSLFTENPLCLTILQAYVRNPKTVSAQGQEQNSWSRRISESNTHDQSQAEEQWSQAHGLLIAYGLLDIDLAGREEGIRYCLTREAVQLLDELPMEQNSGPLAESA